MAWNILCFWHMLMMKARKLGVSDVRPETLKSLLTKDGTKLDSYVVVVVVVVII